MYTFDTGNDDDDDDDDDDSNNAKLFFAGGGKLPTFLYENPWSVNLHDTLLVATLGAGTPSTLAVSHT
jgi:hypothetical protein